MEDRPPGPAHHGSHGPTSSAGEQLWYARTAAELTSPADQLVLDVGCGEALMAIELARVLPEKARIVALDSNPDVLGRAAARIAEAGLTGRIDILTHDLDQLDRVRETGSGADLIWASASLHHVGDQQRVVSGLAELLADDGRLALAEGGLDERNLPWDVGVGEPGLELRLDAAQDRWFTRMRAELPGSVPMPYGWSTALRLAGLHDIVTTSALFEEPAPLTPAARSTVLGSLSHRVDRLTEAGLLDDADARSWGLLLDQDDPAWLGHREDLFSLTARTLYVGRRVRTPAAAASSDRPATHPAP